MKRTTLSGLLILIIAMLAIAGCGNSDDDAQPTTATVKITSQGTLASGTQIGGINVTVVLPAGVTVKATADGNALVTDTGVVVVSGSAAGTNTLTTATYIAASTTMPGKVLVQLANPDGFGTGEFVTVNCDITSGFFPRGADFSVTDFTAVETINYDVLSGLSAVLTADIR